MNLPTKNVTALPLISSLRAKGFYLRSCTARSITVRLITARSSLILSGVLALAIAIYNFPVTIAVADDGSDSDSTVKEQNVSDANEDAADSTNLFKELKVFTDVLAIVQRDYVRKANSKQLVEGAIRGMLTTLDPHSGYLDPDFYQDLQVQTKGEFGGLGIEITVKDGLLVVVAPIEGSPAEKAGLKPQDAIVKIEGKFTKDYTLVDAVKKLRGPKGSPVTISVLRKGQPELITVTLIRDIIAVKSIRERALGDGYAYIRLSQFVDKTSEELTSALADLKKNPEKTIKGLILDLRNNPGGLLNQAVLVGDTFLESGVIVYTDGRVESQKQRFFAHERGTEPNYPIIVLVNGGSASAAEIIAGALKDHGRALILGTQTFGKGSVQTISPLDNGGAITLTTALYYTKSGNSIQARGVTPDIVVEQNDNDETQKAPAPKQGKSKQELIRESDLPGAIHNPTSDIDNNLAVPDNGVIDQNLLDEGQKPVSIHEKGLRDINKTPVEEPIKPITIETVPLQEWMQHDEQFKRAYELIHSYNIFAKTPAEAVAPVTSNEHPSAQ